LDTQQVAPNAGLSNEIFVLSLFPEQTAELMESRPGSPLPGDWSVDDQAITGLAYFDWAGWIEAVEPWVNYALSQWNSAQGAEAGSNATLVTSQVQILLDVLKSWKSYASVSYSEDQASVTRFRMQFQDVP
jgi:hypothetical protein